MSLRLSHVRRFFNETRLEIQDVYVSQLVEWLGSHEWGPAARASARASLQSFFQWSYSCGHIVANPAATIPPIVQPRALPRPASEETISHAIARAGDPRVSLALDIMATCGLRRGEVAKVHSKDLQHQGAGYVLRVVGKGGHARVVPVPPRIAASIAKAPGWLFPGAKDGHISAGWLGKLLSRALPPGVTPHQLRHSYGTRAYAGSGDIRAVQELLGHQSPTTTQLYVQVSTLAITRAARAGWEVMLGGRNVPSGEPWGPASRPILKRGA